MDNAPRIALVLDNPIRDLPPLSLLALELSRRGCRTFLVPMYLNNEVMSLAPDFVLLNYLRKISVSYCRELTQNQIAFGYLDTEGGPSLGFEQHYMRYLCDDAEVNAQAGAACSWGTEIAGELIQRKYYREGVARVTGQPRYDLYTQPWRKAVLDLSAHIPADLDPYVLICSNFGLTNSKYADRETVVKSLCAQYNLTPDRVIAWQESEDHCIEQLIQCARELSQRFPEVKFVYRPHPSESVEFYQSRFEGCPNIIVTRKNEVAGWLLRAQAAVQLNCTTSYDAWFAGTPSFKPKWIQQIVGVGDDLAINEGCETMDILAERIGVALKGEIIKTKTGPQELGLVNRFFGPPDGLAHQRVADAILAATKVQDRPARLACLEKVGKRQWPKLRQTLAAHGMRLTGYQNTWQPDTKEERQRMLNKHVQSEKYYSADLVREWVHKLAQTGGVEAPKVGFARDLGSFQFGSKHGQSVVVEPLSR